MPFGRVSKIEVGKRGETGKAWKGLRFDWQIKKTASSEPNNGEIKVYRWSNDSVNLLRQPGAVIRVFSGYRTPKLLFVGTPNAESGITQPDDKPFTKIKAKDGGAELARAHVSLSFSQPISARAVLNEMATQIGLPVGRVELPDNPTFQTGISFAGKAEGVLNRIQEMTGSSWSIQDGRLRFVDKTKGTGVEVAEFSRENKSIIGRISEDKDGISLKTLALHPELRPEDRFKIGDTEKQGVWRAKRVGLDGSSWADPHYMNLKAVPA